MSQERQPMITDDEAIKIKARMQTASKTLNDEAENVGKAKQVREFASERRKNLLALYIDKDLPSAKAEALARKNPEYLQRFDELALQSEAAEITIAKYAATQHSFEAARSLLSFTRESLRQFEG